MGQREGVERELVCKQARVQSLSNFFSPIFLDWLLNPVLNKYEKIFYTGEDNYSKYLLKLDCFSTKQGCCEEIPGADSTCSGDS